MATRIDEKIQKLEQEKSELDLTILGKKKQEYEIKMYEILESKNDEMSETNAISELNNVRSYRAKIKDTEQKIKNNPELLEDIDRKLSLYKQANKRCKNLQLYKETREWLIETFWQYIVDFAEETDDKEVMNKLKKRSLNPEEYSEILEIKYPEHLLKKLKEKEKEYKEKHKEMDKKYKEVFGPSPKKKTDNWKSQQISKSTISLPEWLSEQIIKGSKWIKDIQAKEIEDFLKKELKKNKWEIKVSHIKNKFWEKAILVTTFLKTLIKDYPIFKIIDNTETKKEWQPTTKSKNEKLLSTIKPEESEENKNKRLRINNLMFKLNEIWKLKSLESRISKYLDLFEELDCDFSDRKEFEPQLYDVITTHSHIEMEKEIIKTLNLLIQWNLRIEKTWLYKYNVFRFNRDSRRMLAYPNWEIFTICPHEEYEKIINTQPPIDKVE